MSIPDVYPADGAPRSGDAKSPRKRRFILVAVLSGAAAFALAGASLAEAVHSLANDHIASSSGVPSAPCPGRPGICPS